MAERRAMRASFSGSIHYSDGGGYRRSKQAKRSISGDKKRTRSSMMHQGQGGQGGGRASPLNYTPISKRSIESNANQSMEDIKTQRDIYADLQGHVANMA